MTLRLMAWRLLVKMLTQREWRSWSCKVGYSLFFNICTEGMFSLSEDDLWFMLEVDETKSHSVVIHHFWDTDHHCLRPVVTKTMQRVLSQFKNFLLESVENWLRSLSLPKVITKCYELVKLRHIDLMVNLFWGTVHMFVQIIHTLLECSITPSIWHVLWSRLHRTLVLCWQLVASWRHTWHMGVACLHTASMKTVPISRRRKKMQR